MSAAEIMIHRVAGSKRSAAGAAVDPVTTEIVRHALDAAAMQMRQVLVRTAFSPVLFEMIDFACALYDREVRLIAQAASMPLFMGSMSFCITGLLEEIGGEANLAPGDVFIYNAPYGTGAHPQDAAMIQPVFLGNRELIGYSVVKAHWMDIGGRGAYCTDTVDVYQEAVVFPGVRLFQGGKLNDDIYRMVRANSRVPLLVLGDVRAQAAGVHAGAVELVRVIERFGLDAFCAHVEHMLDHGEALVRSYFENIPDGRYSARELMDSDGLHDEPVPLEVIVEVKGSTVRLDYSGNVPALGGPFNCPMPTTVALSRVAISMLAGASESPNEGFFRPIEVVTRPGTVFHPLPPTPCFMYGAPAFRALEAIYHAIGQANPEVVPAGSGSDPSISVLWGQRAKTGEPWADGWAVPIGHGAHARDDGGTLMTNLESCTQMPPLEIWEHRNPWFFEKIELAPDSGGAGRHQGGLGIDTRVRITEECVLTAVVERTKSSAWGLAGGGEGRPERVRLHYPDGRSIDLGKVTGKPIPAGAVIEVQSPSGGGWGPPTQRDPERVREELRDGYITERFARQHYPHALDAGE